MQNVAQVAGSSYHYIAGSEPCCSWHYSALRVETHSRPQWNLQRKIQRANWMQRETKFSKKGWQPGGLVSQRLSFSICCTGVLYKHLWLHYYEIVLLLNSPFSSSDYNFDIFWENVPLKALPSLMSGLFQRIVGTYLPDVIQ